MEPVKKYTLKEARAIHGMKQKDLAEASGVSQATVSCIERPTEKNKFAVNEETAKLLARALACDVNEIHWPNGVSYRGRPPCSGIKLTRTITGTIESICPNHFIVLPVSGECPHCNG